MKKCISLAFLALTLSSCGFSVVDTGHRGILVHLGNVQGEPMTEGLYFYNPFTEHIREFSVRQEKWAAATEIFTKDTQKVAAEFTVIYSVDAAAVNKIFKTVGDQQSLEEKIIKPIVLGSIKDAVGRVIADELVSKRQEITRTALKEVKENLAANNVVVYDLQFTNLQFDAGYERAVEEKVIATQQAQKAKNETVTVTEKATQAVLAAKAQAEAMRIQSEALSKNQALVSYEAVKRWDGKLPQYMFGAGTVPFIDMKQLTHHQE